MTTTEKRCALCGRPDPKYFSSIAVYSRNPNGEWLCAEGNSHGPSSREAWACYIRAQAQGKGGR